MWWERSHPQYPHRPPQISTASLTHKRDFSTISNNFQTLLVAFLHRIYKLTNLATFLDKPYGSVRCRRQCCPASVRSDSPGTVLPLSASVLCSELSGREEAVHSALSKFVSTNFPLAKNYIIGIDTFQEIVVHYNLPCLISILYPVCSTYESTNRF